MHFTLSAATFRTLFTNARLAMATKPTLPILDTIRLEVSADGRTLTAASTDLDLTLVQTIPLELPGTPGTACLYQKSLGMVRPDKDTPVRIEAPPFDPDEPAAARISYTSGGLSASSPATACDPAQFPDLPSPPPEEYTCALPGTTLDAITTAIPFMSKDETRYVLNGVLVSPQDGGCIVATDGRRLIRMNTRATPVPCLFPAKLCHALARLKPASATVAITKDTPVGWPNTIGIHASLRITPGLVLHSKLIEGNFPNYRQVIPPDSECTSAITFADPAAVAAWLNSLPEPEKSSSVALTPRAPHHVDLVHPFGTITATAYLQDNPPAITFNPRFLATALSAVGGTLYLIDEISPGTLRGPSALVVLMPMRDPGKPHQQPVNSAKPSETDA